jgi:hypothetical protein
MEQNPNSTKLAMQKLADLFFDLVKLIFAGVILSSVVLSEVPALYIFVASLIIALILIILAMSFYRKGG